MRNSILKYVIAITLVMGSTFGPPVGCTGGLIQPAWAIEAPITDLSGEWQSNFGAVNLKVEGKDANGQAVVSGSWNNAAHIVYGRYQPRTVGGALTVEYYVPARKHYGFAEFKLDVSSTILTGKYYETSQTGDWVLSRARGFRPTTLDKLSTITNLGQNKTSASLNNVVGVWDSTFGPVELESAGYSLGVLVKGKFTRPDGKVGKIVSGTFMRDQKGGSLKFQYVTPWNNGSGTGIFHPDPLLPNRQLLGIYEEGGQKGEWNLSRPLSK